MAISLFVCLSNTCCSQVRMSLFECAGRHRALFAGSEADPWGQVHPELVEVPCELGIDLLEKRLQRFWPGACRAGRRDRARGRGVVAVLECTAVRTTS